MGVITYYIPHNEVRGIHWFHPVCPSMCQSICPLTFRVRPVASTVQDPFFPYLVQMINSMRGCVACNDPWPWSISSRPFGLDLENCVRSVASSVLDGVFFIFGTNDHYHWIVCNVLRFIQNLEICISGKFLKFFEKKSTVLNGFFPNLAQMITSTRGCIAYNDLWPWPISSRLFGLGLENRVCSVASTVLDGFFPYLVQMITSMRRRVTCVDLWPWPISSRSFDLDFENRVRSVTFSVLDRLFPFSTNISTGIPLNVLRDVSDTIPGWVELLWRL